MLIFELIGHLCPKAWHVRLTRVKALACTHALRVHDHEYATVIIIGLPGDVLGKHMPSRPLRSKPLDPSIQVCSTRVSSTRVSVSSRMHTNTPACRPRVMPADHINKPGQYHGPLAPVPNADAHVDEAAQGVHMTNHAPVASHTLGHCTKLCREHYLSTWLASEAIVVLPTQ